MFKRNAEIQNSLLHTLAYKVTIGYHNPNEFPEYQSLSFSGEEEDKREAATDADNLAIRSFFMFQVKRSQDGG